MQCVKDGSLKQLMATIDPRWLSVLLDDFEIFARADQLPAPVTLDQSWTTWLILGGRGAGKTRAGAEWVKGMALGRAPYATAPTSPIALVGETFADVREVMVEGVSGIRAIHTNDDRPEWQASRRRLVWPNGAIAQGFSAEDPESLRGPQFAAAWADELGKWKNPDATWDMLQFGLRLGTNPRQVVTTTPRPIALLKRLAFDKTTIVSRATTRDNAMHLAPSFLETIVKRYAGTRLGRQELDGEFIEDRADALFPREMLEESRVDEAPNLQRIVVAIDPPAGGKRGGICGIICCGRAENGTVYVLEDASIEAARPDQWAAKALSLYHAREADALVAEINQGGDMVANVIRSIDANVPMTPVRATRGKHVRAEPVAALYAQGKVKHVGAFAELEDQMCLFGPDGLSSGKSPDRLDALVWAVTSLALSGEAGTPRVRGV
jgi:phage terminase large subunit-like protein